MCNNKCCGKDKCCCSKPIIRYGGPDIPELGITTGSLLEVVIEDIASYLIEGVATSTLTDNENGTYTHTPGDESGTFTTFTTGRHTSGASPHTSPSLGDTWYDTGTNELKWRTNDGVSDIWYVLFDPTSLPRFKESTVRHSAVTTLTLNPSIHSKREIHIESTGNLLLDGDDHLVRDDYTYLVVNTTSVARTIGFDNVTGAWMRHGGTIQEVSGSGFTVPRNSSLLVTTTKIGSNVYVNGHFSSNGMKIYSTTLDLVDGVASVVTVTGAVNIESILMMSPTGDVLSTTDVAVNIVDDEITMTATSDIDDAKIRVIYT